MTRKRYSSRRKALAASLAVLGIGLWVTAVLAHVAPADVTFSHFEARFMAVVTGGAAAMVGIILLAAR